MLLHTTVAELALNRWEDASAAIEHVLSHSCHVHGPSSRDAERIVRAVFDSTRNQGTLQSRVRLLVEFYEKYSGLHALGIALVRHVADLSYPNVSTEEMERWRDAWIEASGDRVEFEVPLRLLTTAVKYIGSKDPLTLLEIAEEERQVIEPFVGSTPEGEADYRNLSQKIRRADHA